MTLVQKFIFFSPLSRFAPTTTDNRKHEYSNCKFEYPMLCLAIYLLHKLNALEERRLAFAGSADNLLLL